jgi:ubiquinone/menaquinone biosynthesis C-methylase UbiE
VLGLDVSENMLARARSMTATGSIVYERADLETVDLPEAAFDLAYSSLALHYVEDLGRLLATVHRALRPGARLVASMEHPIFTAPRKPEWVVERQGCRSWPLDSYFMEGERRTDWLTKGVIKQHRTLGTLLSQFTRNGFRLAHVADWRPADEQIAHDPQLAKELERPMFLLLAADR